MIFIAAIFFCLEAQCGIVSVNFAFESEAECRKAVEVGANHLAGSGATLISGQCLSIRHEPKQSCRYERMTGARPDVKPGEKVD
jgi:hypothetical protein